MASSPKPPNPYTQASADQKAQSGAAIQSSIINNPNEYGPYGNQVYSIAGWEQTPDATGKMIMTPRYNRTTTLSPDEQKIANLETGTRYNVGTTAMDISSRLPAYMRGSVDSSGWAPWQTGQAFDQATDRPTIEKNMMESWKRGVQPQQKAEDAQLAGARPVARLGRVRHRPAGARGRGRRGDPPGLPGERPGGAAELRHRDVLLGHDQPATAATGAVELRPAQPAAQRDRGAGSAQPGQHAAILALFAAGHLGGLAWPVHGVRTTATRSMPRAPPTAACSA